MAWALAANSCCLDWGNSMARSNQVHSSVFSGRRAWISRISCSRIEPLEKLRCRCHPRRTSGARRPARAYRHDCDDEPCAPESFPRNRRPDFGSDPVEILSGAGSEPFWEPRKRQPSPLTPAPQLKAIRARFCVRASGNDRAPSVGQSGQRTRTSPLTAHARAFSVTDRSPPSPSSRRRNRCSRFRRDPSERDAT
jgi:hypothetical protein